MKKVIGVGVALAVVGVGVVSQAQHQAVEGANAVMPWAYTLNAPADPDATRPDPDEVVRVAGAP